MNLQYNINFEVSSFLFMTVLAYYIRWQYNMTTSKNKSFFRMLLFVIAANFLDVITAITISYAADVPYWVNMILNGIYFGTIVCLSIQFLDYSFEITEKSKLYNIFLIIERIVCIVVFALLVVNCFTGICFDFIDNKYVHGPLYLVIYIVPYVMLMASAVIVLIYNKKWTKSQKVSLFLYYALCMSGVLLQFFFFPDVLLNLFTISLAVVVVLFAMETTDYQQLVHALDEMHVLNAKTQAAIETKRRFIDNISTNIRVPVKHIAMNEEQLLEIVSDEKARNIIEDSQIRAISLIGVLDDILDYSENDIKEIELAEELYDVKGLVEACVRAIEDRAKEKNLDLRLEFDRTLPSKLFGDRDRIAQILRELVLNSIDNTDEGYILVKTTWKEYDKRHVLLLLSVEDSGHGIPDDIKDAIFDSFEAGRENSGLNGEPRIGLGLGLSKRLVEVMNGDIGFYSKEGEGSLFYVEFPQKIFEG